MSSFTLDNTRNGKAIPTGRCWCIASPSGDQDGKGANPLTEPFSDPCLPDLDGLAIHHPILTSLEDTDNILIRILCIMQSCGTFGQNQDDHQCLKWRLAISSIEHDAARSKPCLD